MKDKHGREVNYLRISVTENCNLKCIYCVDENSVFCSENKLTDDDIYKIAKQCAALGISKIRITGGEPLIRKDIDVLIKKLSSIDNIEEIFITSNGVLLLDKIETLKQNGLNGINISIDSLKKDRFELITKSDKLDLVMKGMEKALELGIKVKINTVIVDNINNDEILDFVELTKDKDIDVRFIELMPIGEGKNHKGMKNSEIIDVIKNNYKNIKEEKRRRNGGPAKLIRINDYKGRIGFISAMSDCFCEDCNRIRLTSEGFLKKCLHSNKGVELKHYLNKSDEELRKVIYKTIYNKPEKHRFSCDCEDKETKYMNQIGG